MSTFLSWPGKAMAYGALGSARPEWQSFLESFLYHDTQLDFGTRFSFDTRRFRSELGLVSLEQNFSATEAADLAASLQLALTAVVLREVRSAVLRYERLAGLDGFVLTGGCALNVQTNWAVLQWAAAAASLRVFVPSAPNDGGVSTGMAWLVLPPWRSGLVCPHGFLTWPWHGHSTVCSATAACRCRCSVPPRSCSTRTCWRTSPGTQAAWTSRSRTLGARCQSCSAAAPLFSTGMSCGIQTGVSTLSVVVF